MLAASETGIQLIQCDEKLSVLLFELPVQSQKQLFWEKNLVLILCIFSSQWKIMYDMFFVFYRSINKKPKVYRNY